MNKQQRTQIISYLLTASLLLSFWVCIEGCQAEVVNDCEAHHSVSDSIHLENTDEDSCAVQTAPSVIFSNQKVFASANFSSLPHQSRKAIFQMLSAPVLLYGNEKMFVRLPLQNLRQLRI